jgi:hypothetical protein
VSAANATSINAVRRSFDVLCIAVIGRGQLRASYLKSPVIFGFNKDIKMADYEKTKADDYEKAGASEYDEAEPKEYDKTEAPKYDKADAEKPSEPSYEAETKP